MQKLDCCSKITIPGLDEQEIKWPIVQKVNVCEVLAYMCLNVSLYVYVCVFVFLFCAQKNRYSWMTLGLNLHLKLSRVV